MRLRISYVLIIAGLASGQLLGLTALTRLTNNDPYPLYSSSNPYEFLNRCHKNDIIDYCEQCDNYTFRMTFSPFRQSATQGSDLEENESVELGNLKGPWNLIGLFYDPEKRQDLIRGLGLDTLGNTSVGSCIDAFGINLLTDPAGADTKQQFGYMSVPIKYRKYGIRGEGEVALPCNLTFKVQTGVAHIWQEPNFIDLTCQATGLGCPTRDCCNSGQEPPNNCPCPVESDVNMDNTCAKNNCCIDVPNCNCKQLVIDKIFKQKERLARILNLEIDENLFTSSPYNKTGFEDIELTLNWSQMIPVNKDNYDWPFFVITPFATLGGTIPTSGPINRRNLFALSLGNDGHWSYGGRGGVTIDFIETVSIGGEAGFTGFSSRNHCNIPVPTNELQSGIFPEQATVRIKPGLNWHFAFIISSYRFLDRLSSWVQYAIVNHDKDDFKILSVRDPDSPPILTRKLRDESSFRSHFVNGALNYEISPHVQIGFVWQIPVFQQNAYRSTTFMGSLQILY